MSLWYPIAAFAAFSMSVGFAVARQDINVWWLIVFCVVSLFSLQIGYFIGLLIEMGRE